METQAKVERDQRDDATLSRLPTGHLFGCDARRRRCRADKGSGNTQIGRCLADKGSGNTKQRRCLRDKGTGNTKQRRDKGTGNTKQRRCLRDKGTGNTKQRRRLTGVATATSPLASTTCRQRRPRRRCVRRAARHQRDDATMSSLPACHLFGCDVPWQKNEKQIRGTAKVAQKR